MVRSNEPGAVRSLSMNCCCAIGDLAQAHIRLNALSVDVFIHSRDYLRAMIDSNKRQIKEGAEGAQELEASSRLILLVGIVIAFLVVAALGILITRMNHSPTGGGGR